MSSVSVVSGWGSGGESKDWMESGGECELRVPFVPESSLGFACSDDIGDFGDSGGTNADATSVVLPFSGNAEHDGIDGGDGDGVACCGPDVVRSSVISSSSVSAIGAS